MLELQHISFGVEQDGESKDILRDINLTINERFVAITGPNGGGKSTLAKVTFLVKPAYYLKSLYGVRGFCVCVFR